MSNLLFLQANLVSGDRSANAFLLVYWPVLVPLALGFAAIYLLLPRVHRTRTFLGAAAGGLALVLTGLLLLHAETVWPETLLFYTFSSLAILGGGMMLAQSNPVYAALSFALVVLSTCGLFLLQGAPFLMAATIIIYAGAIVVTFLFVIMLAQQEGRSDADARSREPLLATVAGFVLMGATLVVLQQALRTPELDSVIARFEQIATAEDIGTVRSALGRPIGVAEQAGVVGPPRLIEETRRYFDETRDARALDQLYQMESEWAKNQVEGLPRIKKSAEVIAAELKTQRQLRGTLTHGDVPGKERHAPGEVPPLPARNVHALGQTLFTDYLIPVELAGVLLLVATIGAIAIAGRHSEVLR